jgi:hypothetical protein
MWRKIRLFLLWTFAVWMTAGLAFGALLIWPDPLFAFSLASGNLVVASDRPIPPDGGERVLQGCARLLQRSPLKADGGPYHLYVTNEAWRHHLFFVLDPAAWGLAYAVGGNAFLSGADFDSGQVVHWDYVGTPPRTLAYLCAHEVTHVIVRQHVGLGGRIRMPRWVFEGFADYVGIDRRQSFEQLRDAIGDRTVDVPMMVRYGSYPHYRLLVTYFLERQGWSVEQLLQTRLSEDEADAVMRADAR